MKLLVTGVCGFVGSAVAKHLRALANDLDINGIDNLVRSGSEMNRSIVAREGTHVIHGDLRLQSDVDVLPPCDWVIDAAAQPSVLAGVDGKSSPRQLFEHNLFGTLNLLEYCRRHSAGLILLSTSRVYSIEGLAHLPMRTRNDSFELNESQTLPKGVSARGIAPDFSTSNPISLYGATKLASETMALEYGRTFSFPVWINRCGVLAGAGQFGTAEQGIFSFWIHSHAARRPLRYIGFGGCGYQARDVFHPFDLASLLAKQMRLDPPADPVFNVGGGPERTMSLAQLTSWCDERFGPHRPVADEKQRPFDIPWYVSDSTRTQTELSWHCVRTLPDILEEIAEHASVNPDWLARAGVK